MKKEIALLIVILTLSLISLLTEKMELFGFTGLFVVLITMLYFLFENTDSNK